MKELIVYSRQGCHLCEDMLETLAVFAPELGCSMVVYDVDEDTALFDRFNALVPIVYYKDREVMRYFFELETLRQALQTAKTDETKS